MRTKSIKSALCAIAAAAVTARAGVARAAEHPVSLVQAPLVMRLSKDEFRIAFGLNAGRIADRGCAGVVRYHVDWKTEDGTSRSERRQVNYSVAPRSSRSITVDRQYFDTGEGQHTTEIVRVSVERITCLDAGDAQTQLAAAIAGTG